MKRIQKRKKVLIVILVLLLAAATLLALELTDTTHIFHKSAIVRVPAKPITQTLSPSKNTGVKTPSVGSSTSSEGLPTDKQGQFVSGVPTDPTKWSKSASGVITVKLPSNGSAISSGAVLTGSASIAQIQYRLIDDSRGVISQGPVSVVGGNFTATISFTSHSGTGRLDVFSVEPNGKEVNEVQLGVRF